MRRVCRRSLSDECLRESIQISNMSSWTDSQQRVLKATNAYVVVGQQASKRVKSARLRRVHVHKSDCGEAACGCVFCSQRKCVKSRVLCTVLYDNTIILNLVAYLVVTVLVNIGADSSRYNKRGYERKKGLTDPLDWDFCYPSGRCLCFMGHVSPGFYKVYSRTDGRVDPIVTPVTSLSNMALCTASFDVFNCISMRPAGAFSMDLRIPRNGKICVTLYARRGCWSDRSLEVFRLAVADD